MEFTFNASGNLNTRTGMISAKEIYGYDNLDRLKTVHYGSSSGMPIMAINYKVNGNIQDKTGLGAYGYHPTKVHAVETIENPQGLIPSTVRSVTYNAFNKPSQISETGGVDSYILNIMYGPDQHRWKTELKKNNALTKTVLFAGDYERITEGGIVRQLYYMPGGAIYVKETNQSDKIYYAHKDNLGSIIKLTDGAGTTVFAATYDAWGQQSITNNTFKFHRGYTGHEHLPEFRLINMNARLYDPLIGRVLSPDPYVQMPDFSQSYNRYSYCLNNPLIYVDPDGEWGWLAAGLGFVYGYVSYGLMNGDWGWKAVVSGGITGVMWGIGYTGKTDMTQWAYSAHTAINSTFSSFMPSYNQQIGNSNFSVSISPNIMFGTHSNLGVGVGLNYADENVAFGAGMNLNYTSNGWGFKNNGFNVGSYGYGAVNFGDGYTVSLSRSHFRGSDNQKTSMLGLRHKEWSFYYENDFPLGDGHDRWRTAAVSFNYKGKYGDHGIGVNIYTEQAGYFAGDKNRRTSRMLANGQMGYNASGIEAALYYRNGANYYGISHHKIGNFLQNKVAHDIGTGGSTKHFLWGRDGYGGGRCYDGLFWLYKSQNIYTLW